MSDILKQKSIFFGKKVNINNNGYRPKSAIFYKAEDLVELKYVISQPETSTERTEVLQAVADNAVEEALKIYTTNSKISKKGK